MSAPASAAQPRASRALRVFLATEAAGGVLLVVAAVVALVWANSPWQDGYATFWHTQLGIELGRFELELDLRHWVNDGLMAIFFLVVGLEVKRELLQGELRNRRTAMLPVICAIGGMVVPAVVYLLCNPDGPAARGWGIPMATDIAFALGVLALVARSLPSALRLFLLTLAIVDDIGAIVVIAVFYTSTLDTWWLAAAVATLGLVVLLRLAGLVSTPLFVGLGALLWLTLHASGVHATLAGVAMGLLVPATPALTRDIVYSRGDDLLDVFTPAAAQETSRIARQSVSQLEWLEHHLHGWSSFVIVPVFALANAGIPLGSESMREASTSAVSLGIVLGLVVGKAIGIAGAARLAVRAGVADLPEGASWRQVYGVAALGGIGFTVSLFVANLAFSDGDLVDEARIGIVAASLIASLIGAFLLRSGPQQPTTSPAESR